jgi:hypothetical protein
VPQDIERAALTGPDHRHSVAEQLADIAAVISPASPNENAMQVALS